MPRDSSPARVPKRPSCRLCRVRKVKCVKEDGAERCNSCSTLERACEDALPRRRPGPVSRYSREAMSGAEERAPVLKPLLPSPTEVRSEHRGRGSSSSHSPSQPTSSSLASYTPTPRWDMPTQRSAYDAHLSFLPAPVSDGAPRPPPGGVGTSASQPSDPIKTRTALTASHTDKTAVHIEDVLPRCTAMRILHAYHDYLYPLMPCVHWPSFVQQLVAREDERNRRWRAFVFALLAYSIVQLPRSCLDFAPVPELVRYHQQCFSASRAQQSRTFQDVSSIDTATLYCQHIYLSSLFKKNLANLVLVQAIRLAQEQLQTNCDDAIEAELRRRLFWLLYGSDRTICVMDDTPLVIWDWDTNVPYPLALDDAYLTCAGAFPQPDKTSALAGFHFVTRIFHLLGVVLSALRSLRARRSPPDPEISELLSLPRYAPSAAYSAALDGILAALPRELELRADAPGGQAFTICRVNILISQAMVRQTIQSYAEEMGEDTAGQSRALVAAMLRAMPAESLAANGDSLRMKVLYFVLQGMGSDEAGSSELLDMYMRLRETQEAHVLHEAPDLSDEDARGDGTPPVPPPGWER
ncbi:hypothetical protein CspeluHIS016_0803680 [Cutaneotrichosporon spelunceum]|uniref:Zn(2)-C6 fungal-type domain-containing protein n=1 Tax=Cutaneotrichosporon spelunceum TaxID=1672016 RepID=A0AAD3TZP0_9TREE|nr:hypothetical protein CspeluHIS016_0803680 [Cutaneotrichosporon spelunceum]